MIEVVDISIFDDHIVDQAVERRWLLSVDYVAAIRGKSRWKGEIAEAFNRIKRLQDLLTNLYPSNQLSITTVDKSAH